VRAFEGEKGAAAGVVRGGGRGGGGGEEGAAAAVGERRGLGFGAVGGRPYI
jgi:hypothetical protein